MKQFSIIILSIGAIISLVLAEPADAVTLLDWDITFIGTEVDVGRSGMGGFDTWLKWKYRITTDSDGASQRFSHFLVGLPDLPHISDNSGAIASSGGDTSLGYEIQFRDGDGPLHRRGLDWNNFWERLQGAGESDVFFFSTPESLVATVEVGIKRGGTRSYGSIDGPGSFIESNNTVPEPSSMFLLGMGLLGAGVFKRKKKA